MIQGHLRRFPRFDGLSDDEIRVLEREMVARPYRPGQTLMRQGDRARGSSAAMFLVLEGAVELWVAPKDGPAAKVRVLGPGELIGVIALIRDVRRTATAKIRRKALVATLDRLTLDRLQVDHPGAWARLQQTIAQQLAADFRAVHRRLSDALHET